MFPSWSWIGWVGAIRLPANEPFHSNWGSYADATDWVFCCPQRQYRGDSLSLLKSRDVNDKAEYLPYLPRVDVSHWTFNKRFNYHQWKHRSIEELVSEYKNIIDPASIYRHQRDMNETRPLIEAGTLSLRARSAVLTVEDGVHSERASFGEGSVVHYRVLAKSIFIGTVVLEHDVASKLGHQVDAQFIVISKYRDRLTELTHPYEFDTGFDRKRFPLSETRLMLNVLWVKPVDDSGSVERFAVGQIVEEGLELAKWTWENFTLV